MPGMAEFGRLGMAGIRVSRARFCDLGGVEAGPLVALPEAGRKTEFEHNYLGGHK